MLYKLRESANTRAIKLIHQIQFGVKTKIHQIACAYYKRKPSGLIVLNVKILIQTLFTIDMK